MAASFCRRELYRQPTNRKSNRFFMMQSFRHSLIVPALLSCSLGWSQQAGKPATAAPSRAKSSSTVETPELTPVADPATAAQIRELLDLTGATRNATLMVGRMVDQMKSQAPAFFPQDFWADLQHSFQHLDAQSVLIPYYQKYYSQPDAEKAIAFYKSSAGRRLVAVQPVIMQKAQKLVTQHAEQIGQQVLLRHKAELEALAKQYQQGGAGGGIRTPNATPQSSAPGSPRE